MISVYHNPNLKSDSESGLVTSWEKCVHVADVLTEDLEEALNATNKTGEINFKQHLVQTKTDVSRPTSDGDILVHNDQKYLVQTFGFLALEDSKLNEKAAVKEAPAKELKRKRPKLRL
jgi:hypothetical protein